MASLKSDKLPKCFRFLPFHYFPLPLSLAPPTILNLYLRATTGAQMVVNLLRSEVCSQTLPIISILAEFHFGSSQRSVLHYTAAQTSRWISFQWRIQFSPSVFYKQAFKEWIWGWHEATHRKTRGKWTETSIHCDCLHYQSNVLCWRNCIWILNHLPEEI